MLDALGIDDLEQRVYLALIEEPGATASELALPLKLSARHVSRILDNLEQKGLVSHSADRRRRFSPSPPDIAISALILEKQEQLERARLKSVELTRRLRDASRTAAATEVVEVVRGREAIVQRLSQLQSTAKREFLVFDKPPYAVKDAVAGNEPKESEILRRKVETRVVYEESTLHIPGKLEHIRRMVELGERARLSPRLPMKLAIADRRLGFTPFLGEPEYSALLVYESPLLDGLIDLFEVTWGRSVPVSGSGEPARVELAPEDRRILMLLSAGTKDQAIARNLGLGISTVKRRVGILMGNLGARSRFQAGAMAVMRGWIPLPIAEVAESKSRRLGEGRADPRVPET